MTQNSNKSPHKEKLIPLNLIKAPEISPGSKLCWMILLLASEDFKIDGQQGLADCLGVTGRQIKRYLAELENNGLLIRKKDSQTHYKLAIPSSIWGEKSESITDFFLLEKGNGEGTWMSLGAEEEGTGMSPASVVIYIYYSIFCNTTSLKSHYNRNIEKGNKYSFERSENESNEKQEGNSLALFKRLRKSRNKNYTHTVDSKVKNQKVTIEEHSCPNKLEPYIRYWIEKKLSSPDRTTKVFKKAVDHLRLLSQTGTMFDNVQGFEFYANRKFTFEEWKTAVDNYTLALSPQYYPTKKTRKRIYLPDFICNPYAATKFSISPFIFYLENKPRRVEKTLPDENPVLTKCLIELYQENVLGGVKEELPIFSKNKFIDASTKLYEFFKRHQDKIRGYFALTPYKKAELLWNAIYKDVGDSKPITPGFFCSERTFSQRLPMYLFAERVINKDEFDV